MFNITNNDYLETISDQNQTDPNTQPWNVDTQPVGYVDEVQQYFPMSPKAADDLAFKVHYGLGDILKKSRDEIYNDLMIGQENPLRSTSAAELNLRKQQAIDNALVQLAKNKNNLGIGPEDVNFLTRSIMSMKPDTDPATVFEQAYARRYMQAVEDVSNSQKHQTVLSKAAAQLPTEYENAKKAGGELTAKYEYTNSIAKRVMDGYEQQGWIPWTADQLKTFFPGYMHAKLYDTSVEGMGLLGGNMEALGLSLWKLPFPEFKAKVDSIVAKLMVDNPTMAITFLKSIQGMGTSDVVMNNVFPFIDLAGIPAFKITKSVAARVGITNEARTAFKTHLKAIDQAEITPSTIAGAAGDLPAAGTSKAAAELLGDQKGMLPEPTKAGWDQLPSAAKVDAEDIRANPGNFGQEFANRIAEEYIGGFTGAMLKIYDALRVNRMGEIMSMETTVKAIAENIKDRYPGYRNRILNITKPYTERFSNTWFNDVILGDNGAKYFSSREAAEEFARKNGLMVPKIESKAGVTMDVPNVYYLPKAAIKRDWETADRLGTYSVQNGKPIFTTDDGAFVDLLDKPTSGTIPVQVMPDGSMKFHPEIKSTAVPGQTFYIPSAAVRREWETGTRIGSVENKGGVPKFRTDDGAEVVLHTDDQPGFVRMDVMPDGSVSFANPPVSIEQQGIGYYIRMSVPVRETDGYIRSAINDAVRTEGSRSYSPRGILNDFVAKLRTPEETLSLEQRSNRKISTYAISIFRDLMTQNAKEIKELKGWTGLVGRQRWEDWERVVLAGADMTDPETKLKGYFYKSPGELETHYRRLIGRAPDEKEVRAYFAFKRGMEMDRAFRNIAQYRNMTRLGVESHALTVMGKGGETLRTKEFNAVRINDFPGGEGNILIMGNNLGEENVFRLGSVPKNIYDEVSEGIKQGRYKIVEVYAPERREFRGFGSVGNQRIRYVVTPNLETKPLSWNQVSRRGGGHIEYDYDFYLKQASVKQDKVGNEDPSKWRNVYEGDVTVMGVPLRAMGEDYAKHLNTVRLHMKADEWAEAEAASAKLGMSWEDVRAWFEPTKDDEGIVHGPLLSLDEPIYVVKRGESTVGMSKEVESRYSNFFDGTKSGSLSKQFQVEYTGERDAHDFGGLVNKGSVKDPLYQINPAEKIDPVSTMNRALNRIVTSTYMDDYKIFSVEHWLAEATPWLNESATAVRHSPFWHFNNPEFKKDVPIEIQRRLMAQHMQIRQLIGIPSDAEAFLQNAGQKMADSIYNQYGQKALVIDPAHVLPKLKDPTRAVRAFAFHTGIGLFSIPQFIVQGMNHVNMAAIAGPVRALQGTAASQFHFWSTVNHNPGLLKHIDNVLVKSKTGWKPGEFTEARQAMIDSGFGNVGREYAALDDIGGAKVVGNAFDSFLDMGGVFFRGGERNARYSAWYTSYKEWRTANPTAKLDDTAKAAILERADLLNMNMSRASSSMMHTGLLAIPAQFYTYQLRVTELMLGKRLTGKQKLSMLGTNAMMYGLPVAGGIYGLPFADFFRKSAQEYGYVVGDSFIQSAFMEGVPSTLIAMATGGGDASKGDWYNFGDRYGTGGFKIINDFFRGDKTAWDVFGGASYSKIKSTWESTDGFRRAMTSFLRNDNEYFPVTADDLVDVTKEASSMGAAVRLGWALNTGRWMSKNETFLEETTASRAIVNSLTGMVSQRTSDVYRKSEVIKDYKASEQRAEKNYLTEFRRYVQAHKDNNPELAKTYMIRAKAILIREGYPEDKWVGLIKRGYDNNKSLVDRVDWEYYMKTGNRARVEKLREPLRKSLTIERNKQEGNQ